jgi:dipeptidyl aminopeptidase/acylaminoacyl peptidase
MTDQEYGPLDAALVAAKRLSVDELSSSTGALWWLQSDPDQGGATHLMRWTLTTGAQQQSPPSLPIGGWLHAYGGGSYTVNQHEIWVIGAEDSKIHRIDQTTGRNQALATGDDFLYGDLHTGDGRVLAVRGTDDGDEIVEIGPAGHRPRVLVRSPGFLGAPRLHGGRLAYLEWDADRMPWDSSRLLLADYHHRGELSPAKLLAGGPGESVVQPTWGPDGRLHFISDRSGWWNLYRWDDGRPHALVPMAQDCAPAPWEGGYQSYAFLRGRRIALTVHYGIRASLLILESDGRTTHPQPEATSVKPYLAVHGRHLAAITSTSLTTPSVVLLDPTEQTGTRLSADPSHPSLSVTAPQSRTLNRAGDQIHYLLHVPRTTGRGPVPLLVRAHPGPTDDIPQRLDWTVQFFTSGGFAVAEVAYRGSTGQGRAFRQALHGHWGTFDVQDCADVARHLVSAGTAAPDALFLTGASAGGYTALQAASRLDSPFTAVTATSAIFDPAHWSTTAPRFQRPHAAILAGTAGAVRAEEIRMPVLLIHGTADAIAPVQDAHNLADALHARGADHETLFLPGVDHYLSTPHSLRQALETELAFYARITARTT